MPQVAQSFIPPSLTPGPQHARIWDKTTVQRTRTSHGTMASPPQPSLLYGAYFNSQLPVSIPSPPPLPQKPQALFKPLANSLPPIPPKPPALAIAPACRIPLYPTSIPLPVGGLSPQPPDSVAFETMPTLDKKDIDWALAHSATEARKREQELIAQEEEELARALEESRLLCNCIYSFDEQIPSPSTSLKPPFIDRASITAIKGSAHPPEGESWLHLITPTASTSSQNPSINEDFSSSHPFVNHDESDSDPSKFSRETPNDPQSLYSPRRNSSPIPPLYANAVSDLVRSPPYAPSPTQSTVVPSSPSATSTSFLQSDYTLSSDRIATSPSLTLSSWSSSSEHSSMPSFSPRPSWTSVSSENSSCAGNALGSELLHVSGHKSPTHLSASPDLPAASLNPLDERAEEEVDDEPGPSTRPSVPLSANQYVERDLLVGVCTSRLRARLASLFDLGV